MGTSVYGGPQGWIMAQTVWKINPKRGVEAPNYDNFRKPDLLWAKRIP